MNGKFSLFTIITDREPTANETAMEERRTEAARLMARSAKWFIMCNAVNHFGEKDPNHQYFKGRAEGLREGIAALAYTRAEIEELINSASFEGSDEYMVQLEAQYNALQAQPATV